MELAASYEIHFGSKVNVSGRLRCPEAAIPWWYRDALRPAHRRRDLLCECFRGDPQAPWSTGPTGSGSHRGCRSCYRDGHWFGEPATIIRPMFIRSRYRFTVLTTRPTAFRRFTIPMLAPTRSEAMPMVPTAPLGVLPGTIHRPVPMAEPTPNNIRTVEERVPGVITRAPAPPGQPNKGTATMRNGAHRQ